MSRRSRPRRRPIVVAVDGGPESATALRWAAMEAAQDGHRLKVVTAYPHVEFASDMARVAWAQRRRGRAECHQDRTLTS